MIRTMAVSAAILIALAACSKPAETGKESDVVPLPAPDAAEAPAAPAPVAAPAAPAGPAEPAQERTDDYATSAAHVTQVEQLANLDAKLFSTAGGDPAINGLVTHIAFPPENAAESWRVFQVGDFEEWKVSEQGPGRAVLSVRVSRIDPSSGNPVTENKRLIVNYTTGENPTVTVTPAG